MKKNNLSDVNKKIAFKVSIVTIAVNVALAVFKLIAGLIGKSSAMISDSVHSASDIFSTIVVIIGVAIAARPTDRSHPYGHERIECVCSAILAVLLFETGIFIGYKGVNSLVTGDYKTTTPPELIALIAAIASIVVKECMYWYTIISAKKINSVSLKADAWHHRSDALSSVGSLIGIGGAMLFNLPILDVIASLVICLLIFKVALDIFMEAMNKMVDKSCPQEFVEMLKETLLSIDGVLSVDDIKTRTFGDRFYVDVEIGADENLPLKEAHGIAEAAHDAIEISDRRIKQCMVHVNPLPSDYSSEAAALRHENEEDKI